MIDKDARFDNVTTISSDNCDGSGGMEMTVKEKNCSALYTAKKQITAAEQGLATLKSQWADVLAESPATA